MIRGYLVNARRNNSDMTQDEVANLAGIKRQYYCSLEAGGKGGQITLLTAAKLAKALNMALEEFYSLENEYKLSCERELKARKAKKTNMYNNY